MKKYDREWKWEHVYSEKKMQPFPERIRMDLRKVEITPFKSSKGSFYLFGPVGGGKTFEACKIALEAMKWDFLNVKNSITHCGYYNVPDLLLRIRNTYSKDATETEMDVYRELRDISYLILDDLGVEKNSEWALQTLYVILNYRYENVLPVIITSNFSLEELKIRMDNERIVSRIEQMCTSKLINNIDLRR